MLLLSFADIQPRLRGPRMALQRVSLCCSRQPFRPPDQAHLGSAVRKSLLTLTLLSPLTEPTYGSEESKSLLSWAPFKTADQDLPRIYSW
jgi:hypothetical protein